MKKTNFRSSDEIKAIEKAVMATMEIEGLKASVVSIDITRQFLKGEITSNQAIERIKNLYGFKN